MCLARFCILTRSASEWIVRKLFPGASGWYAVMKKLTNTLETCPTLSIGW